MAERLGTRMQILRSPSRRRPLPDLRAIIAKNLHLIGFGTSEIGRILARDHSTVYHLIEKYDDLYVTDEAFMKLANKVRIGIWISV